MSRRCPGCSAHFAECWSPAESPRTDVTVIFNVFAMSDCAPDPDHFPFFVLYFQGCLSGILPARADRHYSPSTLPESWSISQLDFRSSPLH